MSLSDVLSLGRNLVQHWEILNGCASSEAHLGPLVFRFMADAIGRVLTLYEIAIEGVLKRGAMETRGSSSWQSYGTDVTNLPYATPASRPDSDLSRHSRSLSRSSPPTFVGSLELDDEEEIAIVARESLKHSVIRLGAMLQDIEEETRQCGPNELSEVEQPLQDKEVKELIGRLFRLLGRVNGPAGTQ